MELEWNLYSATFHRVWNGLGGFKHFKHRADTFLTVTNYMTNHVVPMPNIIPCLRKAGETVMSTELLLSRKPLFAGISAKLHLGFPLSSLS